MEKYSIQDVLSNSTLGFEKILAINLPSRSDRSDLLTLAALQTDIELEWMDGVKGSEISPKAWPAHWNTRTRADGANFTLGELGCWRSHMNALRRVIDEKWSTVLILEDDADWDVNIRSQLAMLAERTRTMSNARHDQSEWITDDTPTSNPYGNDWDLLWLGPCANPPGPEGSPTFPGESGSQPHWVYYASGGMACTWGYAVTQKSARALMGYMVDVDRAVEEAMSSFCDHNDCILVWPGLIGSHKAAGGLNVNRNKDSDTGNVNAVSSSDGQGEYREKGTTGNVANSAILAALELWGTKRPWGT